MTKELSRISALAERHKALGSGLEDWYGMGTAWSYNSNTEDEHNAIRESAGMFDMSPLKKVVVSGADAKIVLDYTITRDLLLIEPGQSAYTSVLTDEGTMADDAIVSNNGAGEWMIVHGSGDTMALLQASAEGKNVEIWLNEALHNISVQGPKSLGILNAHCSFDLAELAYFHHRQGELFGYPCRISRTGYSGERGYELLADQSVIGHIWDRLAAEGVMPCSFTALDKVRIEAGLLFYGYDMSTERTPWEVGLGFTVGKKKSDFRGRQSLWATKGKDKIKNICLEIDHTDSVNGAERLELDGVEVGVVNSPCYSHRLKKSLALAHVKFDIQEGTVLDLLGEGIKTTATIVSAPIYDPQKTLTHS